MSRRTSALLRGALLLSIVLGGSAPVWAQLTIEPVSLLVTLSQGEVVERTLALTNIGSEPLVFCLSFERPLEEGPEGPRLASDVLSSACGEYGEELTRIENVIIDGVRWDTYGTVMTPDGRLLTADSGGFFRTYELTPDLQLVRWFQHPVVEEVAPVSGTSGLTYNLDTETLWWTNNERPCSHINNCVGYERVLLLEGNLDGVPTGRRIDVPISEESQPPADTGLPTGGSYDAVADRYYYIDIANDNLWAIDTLGTVIEGYPVEAFEPEDPPAAVVDAHRDLVGASSAGLPGDPAEGVYVEIGLVRLGDRVTRIAALYGDGSPSGIETTVPAYPGGEKLSGQSARSRLDPNGVLYYPIQRFGLTGVVAVRPHPLPPSWLSLDSLGTEPPVWDGVLAPGESTEVALTFSAGTRVPGEYTVALQAFDAATERVAEVPLVMEVTPATDTEEESSVPETSSLSVYPNPFEHTATVALTLDSASEMRVVVYDVLGREVAILHEGRLTTGRYTMSFDASGLPAGVYFVRAEGDGHQNAIPFTVLK